jgi:uncharacterized protein (TIGR03790 family)
MPRLLGLFVLLALAGLAAVRAEERAARVVLLANSSDEDSLRVARHYAEARGAPSENIIALPMPRAETITWTEFVATIWTPLQKELVRQRWIDAMAMDLVDAVGRTKLAASGHRIAHLVVCRGVPLRIAHDPERYAAALPFTHTPVFRINAGAVDSELGLLANPNYAINAFVPNPLHRNDAPTRYEAGQVIKVARLDGPTVEDALALVDRAIAAEKAGLAGRAYVDIGGNNPDGDRWLESVVVQLRDARIDTDVDRALTTMPATARFDAPALYFGWYAGEVNGPFKLPGFRFPPGAIALHIHSYSAQTLRSAESNWCGPLIARGATATVGNVFEPYLQLTHRPDLLVRALLRGEAFGDAACYAQPVLSWQTVVIGDPLYRPFPKTGALHAPAEGSYATVRQMLALEATGQPEDALALARRTQEEHPSLVVGLALAQRLHAAGDQAGAAAALAFVPGLGAFRTDEWALARESAHLLTEGGRVAEALAVWRNLLDGPSLPAGLCRVWLPEAIELARRARYSHQAAIWHAALQPLIERASPPSAKETPLEPDVPERQKR